MARIRLTPIQWLSLLGIVLSVYAYHVETTAQADPTYVAWCDLSQYVKWISCSKVFTSKYGHVLSYIGLVEKGSDFDQPNALLGCIYYVAAFLHDVLRFIPGRRELMLGAALFTSALSLWLGYLLVWVLGDFCIVCASTYLINWATLYHAYNRSMFGRKGVKQHAS